MKQMAGWMRNGDVSTFFWVNRSWRCTLLDVVMPALTHVGGSVCCVMLVLLLLCYPDVYWRGVGFELGCSLLSGTIIVHLCKRFRPRPRPYQALPGVSTGKRPLRDPSFPSGHSTAAFCTAVVLDSALPAFGAIFYLFASGIALSRVYLGLHYPSDIMVGALLGCSVGWLYI